MKKVKITPNLEIIQINMYLKPVFFENSTIFSDVSFDAQNHRYLTSVNPQRNIYGPLSGPGEELGYPLRKEWKEFIDDCRFLIETCGFTIISSETRETSKNSEYILFFFGMKDEPCRKIVFELRILDHPFDVNFPVEMKQKAIDYLKVNEILDKNIAEDKVAFVVKKVTIGTHANDSWNRAFNRLFLLLKKMRNIVRAKVNSEKS